MRMRELIDLVEKVEQYGLCGGPLVEKVIRVADQTGETFIVTKNPSRQQFIRDTSSETCDFKGLIKDNDLYYWPAWHAHHHQIDYAMSIGGGLRIFIQHNAVVAASVYKDVVVSNPVLQMLYRGDVPFFPE